MGTKWDQLFGTNFYFVITNEERKYMGLNPMEDSWEMSQFYSKTNYWHKRTSLFWEGDRIPKVVFEQKRVVDEKITYESITEYDTDLQTESREWLLPLSARGKKKKVNATNVLAVAAFGCEFHFTLDTARGVSAYMMIHKPRCEKGIAIGEKDKIAQIRTDTDFHDFMSYYIETCPSDYLDKVKALRESEHVTVKYQTGDVFRMELDRFHYNYGIITGQIRNICKWKGLPEHHSLRKTMMIPIMVRYYDICTTNPNISIAELSQIPLGRVDICADNDIIWGQHTIIGHKELEEEDIEFNLICTKIKKLNEHVTVHTYDFLVASGVQKYPDAYDLYVEWGTANTVLPFEDISSKLKEYLKEYYSPHGGVAMGIFNHSFEREEATSYNLLDDTNKEMREELFWCLGLEPNADFDAFAHRFGGVTKKEILKKKL